MQDTNFDRLLRRYLHNELTPEENTKFSAWLTLLEKENAGDLQMSAEGKEKLFQKITSRISTVDDVIALYPRQPLVKRLFSYRPVQVAAIVLVMLSVTFSVQYFMSDADRVASTREKMILSDGTIAWISESSSFSYYEKDGARYASFNGEALFEVARNPASPFTILCGNINVRVLGTSFTLKTDSAQIELKVLTGRVNVTSVADKVGVDVNSNEKIVYSNTGIIERTSITTEDMKAVTENREYYLKFKSATMDEVIKGISKKFDVTIIVKNQNINKCHVSADFTDHSLEDTLSILKDLLDVSYRITDKRIELSGAGC